MNYSDNNRYFVFVGNLTYCTPDTIASKVVNANPETAIDEIANALVDLRSVVENHPDDEFCQWVFPEISWGKKCDFASAEAEFTAYRDFKVLKAKTYKPINS